MLLLKHIDNNLYIIDTEAEIEAGDLCTCDLVAQPIVKITNLEYAKQYSCKKITAQLNDQLSGVPLFDLPDEKVDVEKLADLIYPHSRKFISVAIENSILKVGFIAGYNLCLSDNKERKYTEADMIKAIDNAFSAANFSTIRTFHQDLAKFKNDYFKAITTPNLQQYDGKRVEIEAELNQCDGCNSNIPIVNGIHKSPYPSGSMVCQKHKYGKIIITKIV